MLAVRDERSRAGVDRRPRQLGQERARRLAARARSRARGSRRGAGPSAACPAARPAGSRRDPTRASPIGLPAACRSGIACRRASARSAPSAGRVAAPRLVRTDSHEAPGASSVSRRARSERIVSGVTSTVRETCRALTPGRPGAAPCGRQRVGVVAEGRRDRDEPDAPERRLQVARGARLLAVLADAGVDEAGVVEAAARLPHPLDSPVQRVIVGPGHEVEAEPAQIRGNLRRRRRAPSRRGPAYG